MIRFTYLLHGEGPVSGPSAKRSDLAFTKRPGGPVIFWNITARCNLACTHCYLRSGPGRQREDELTTDEAIALIDDLVTADVPLLLFSGGEPLMREDFWDLIEHTRKCGLPAALSTNGTLITPRVAQRLRDTGIGYAGISLDGATAATHDAFRRAPGSFDRSVQALRNCIDAGLRCGVRFTVTKKNHSELGDLIALARILGVHRFCVYWLVPSGGEAISTRTAGHTRGGAGDPRPDIPGGHPDRSDGDGVPDRRCPPGWRIPAGEAESGRKPGI